MREDEKYSEIPYIEHIIPDFKINPKNKIEITPYPDPKDESVHRVFRKKTSWWFPERKAVLDCVYKGDDPSKAIILQVGHGSPRTWYVGAARFKESQTIQGTEGNEIPDPLYNGDFMQGLLQNIPVGQRPSVYYFCPPHSKKPWKAPHLQKSIPLTREALRKLSMNLRQIFAFN